MNFQHLRIGIVALLVAFGIYFVVNRDGWSPPVTAVKVAARPEPDQAVAPSDTLGLGYFAQRQIGCKGEGNRLPYIRELRNC